MRHNSSPRTQASLKYRLAVRGKLTAENIKSDKQRLTTNDVVACLRSLLHFVKAITVSKFPRK